MDSLIERQIGVDANDQTWRADPGRHTGMQNTSQNRTMKPAGVHHVAICVADVQKGLAFYRDVLGMTQLPRPDLGPGSTPAASRYT
jgi:hypothetical protein